MRASSPLAASKALATSSRDSFRLAAAKTTKLAAWTALAAAAIAAASTAAAMRSVRVRRGACTRDSGLLFREQPLQLAGLVHLAHDVAAAHELAVHVELRDGRPVREILDALADLRVLQHVDGVDVLRAAHLEDLARGGREAAHRRLRRALHVEHHRVAGDLLADSVLNAHRKLLEWRAGFGNRAAAAR